MSTLPRPVEAPPATSRPAYLQPTLLALVTVGGAVGTWARAGLSWLMPREAGGWPWSTLLVNLVGGFVLAVLLEALGRLRRAHLGLRLLLGTGLLGGFTTYSAFALETADLLRSGHEFLALLYVLASIGGGLMVAMLGVWLTSPGRSTVWGRPVEHR